MLAQLTSEKFIQPKPQDVLDGELGLTAEEIAESLGVKLNSVLKKIRRARPTKVDRWRRAPYGVVHKINGLEYQSYVLNVRAAKSFVARWDNDIADQYVDFLFDCEEIVTEKIPLLIEEGKKLETRLNEAEAQLEALKQPTIKNKGGKKVKYTPYLEVNRTIFDEDPPIYVKRTKKQDVSTMTESEYDAYKVQHLSQIAKGNMKKIETILEKRISDDSILLGEAKKATKIAENLCQKITRPDLKEVPIGDPEHDSKVFPNELAKIG